MEDEAIVALFLARDETAISMAAEKYGAQLRSLALGIVGDRSAAEECENDTYFKAWASIPPHEPRGYLYAFLARITRHTALNCCRERRSLKRSALVCELTKEMEECIPDQTGTAEPLDALFLKDALNGFLAALSVEKRNVFLRRYWYMDSISAIAKGYGMSESKVKTMLLRCRNQFRSYLWKEGYQV